jgi:hypothetical protein
MPPRGDKSKPWLECRSSIKPTLGAPVGLKVVPVSQGSPRDLSQMSLAEVHAEVRRRSEQHREGVFGAPAELRDVEYLPRDLIAEVSRILADMARFIAERPEIGARAFSAAQVLASWRDEARGASHRHGQLGHLASLFTMWLIQRADREAFADDLQAAHLAAAGSPMERRLADDLRAFVEGYLGGTIDDDEFARRLKKPRGKSRRQATPPRPPLGEDAITVHSVEATLVSLLAEAGDERLHHRPARVWEVFKRFAVLPVSAVPPERLDDRGGDLLLFEWGVYERPVLDALRRVFLVNLVRQFSILDEDDDYDRLEQLHCSVSLEPSPEFEQLGSGVLWSGPSLEAWFAEVEQSDGFTALRNATALDIHVGQELI